MLNNTLKRKHKKESIKKIKLHSHPLVVKPLQKKNKKKGNDEAKITNNIPSEINSCKSVSEALLNGHTSLSNAISNCVKSENPTIIENPQLKQQESNTDSERKQETLEVSNVLPKRSRLKRKFIDVSPSHLDNGSVIIKENTLIPEIHPKKEENNSETDRNTENTQIKKKVKTLKKPKKIKTDKTNREKPKKNHKSHQTHKKKKSPVLQPSTTSSHSQLLEASVPLARTQILHAQKSQKSSVESKTNHSPDGSHVPPLLENHSLSQHKNNKDVKSEAQPITDAELITSQSNHSEPIQKKQRKNRKKVRMLEVEGSATKQEVFNNIRTNTREMLQYLFVSPETSSEQQLTQLQNQKDWPFSNLYEFAKRRASQNTTLDTLDTTSHSVTMPEYDKIIWIWQFELALFNNINGDLSQYIRQMDLFYAVVSKYGSESFLECDPSKVAVFDFESEYLMHAFVELQREQKTKEDRNKESLSIDAIIQTDKEVHGTKKNNQVLWFLTCKKCGSKANFVGLQTRSGDEGATIFYGCTNSLCGKRWTG